MGGVSNPPMRDAESIMYQAGLQDSGDLEPATNNIVITAKPGLPQYTAVLNVPQSPSTALTVLRTVLRLDVTIDSFGAGATQLNYSVEVGGVEKLAGSFATPAGSKNASIDLTDLPPGAWNVSVFLWANHVDGAVVSLVQVRGAVGTRGNVGVTVIRLSEPNGALVSGFFLGKRTAAIHHLYEKIEGQTRDGRDVDGDAEIRWHDAVALVGDLDVVMWTDLAGELSYLDNLALGVLRV